jgi:zinc protease
LLERETNNGRASALGEAAVLYRDPNRVNTDLAKLQAVTAEQLTQTLSRYLSGPKKVTVEYLPEAMRQNGKTTKDK